MQCISLLSLGGKYLKMMAFDMDFFIALDGLEVFWSRTAGTEARYDEPNFLQKCYQHRKHGSCCFCCRRILCG